VCGTKQEKLPIRKDQRHLHSLDAKSVLQKFTEIGVRASQMKYQRAVKEAARQDEITNESVS
jgi:hypothetical protein